MIIVPYLPVHLLGLVLQEGQKQEQVLINPVYAEMCFQAGPAWSGIIDGEVVGCAGIWDQGHKAHLWALLSDKCKGHMVRITRQVLKNLPKHKRLEFYVRDEQQKKWAEMLGFTPETPQGMQGYCPDGATAFMYSRIQ